MIKFFQNIPKILAVMSEQEDGSMKLFKDSDLNLENRKRFFEEIGIGGNKIIAAEIVHGVKVEVIDNSSLEFILEADGIITKDANIFLSVTIADCIPVYLYESEQRIIGVLHCGWRGIVSGIIENAIKRVMSIDGKVEKIKIAMGPGINSCHFEIGNDVLCKFKDYAEFVIRRENKIFVDLKGIIIKQLNGLGIDSKNIENNKECTMESDMYFSFRRDKPRVTEAMVAVIGLK